VNRDVKYILNPLTYYDIFDKTLKTTVSWGILANRKEFTDETFSKEFVFFGIGGSAGFLRLRGGKKPGFFPAESAREGS
jgi:hypothetical protein